ncbi:unnamed protein product [Prorocentrum cordatum]|uniref:Uncharacterized protein n=1 Tax=Prorocentrum cordatum TaxID=2364126 RepID=A0ABN9WBY8_9DINO|nr:unnamed protein product [Polarella glacialis]
MQQELLEDDFPLVVCKVKFAPPKGTGPHLLALNVGDLVRVTSVLSQDVSMYHGFLERRQSEQGWFPRRAGHKQPAARARPGTVGMRPVGVAGAAAGTSAEQVAFGVGRPSIAALLAAAGFADRAKAEQRGRAAMARRADEAPAAQQP